MRVLVHFNNVALSEALNNYLRSEVESLFEKFGIFDGHADVHLGIVRGRTELRAPIFSCEINFKSDHPRIMKKINCDGRDLYKALDQMLSVLNKSLASELERRNNHKRADKRRAKRNLVRDVHFINRN